MNIQTLAPQIEPILYTAKPRNEKMDSSWFRGNGFWDTGIGLEESLQQMVDREGVFPAEAFAELSLAKPKRTFRMWRKSQGLSQKDVGKKLGIISASVQHWESGRTYPTRRYRRQLESMTGIKMEFLFPQRAQ